MIIKPDCLSQGKGIFLATKLENIPNKEPSVVQEYLNTPYLIDGLKFDMRVYVLVTCCEPLKIFVHREGLIRFATESYRQIDLKHGHNINNQFMHLTNYAINKQSSEFVQATSVDDVKSHKRSMTQLYKRLSLDGHNPYLIQEQIDDIIIKTLVMIQHELAHSYRTCLPGC